MPTKKRKYNARFPAGRIKKIMQTDEEVGKVAQAVPVIISPRTLELFVESLLSKAMHVTVSRSAKTLSPSHVKQCILAESRFDFLKDLVKNIPDVSVAEEKEMMSEENSPNAPRFNDVPPAPKRLVREDSNSSSGSDVRAHTVTSKDIKTDDPIVKIEPDYIEDNLAIDLSKRPDVLPVRTANFYQETLNMSDEIQHKSVITPNPSYATAQPSTSSYASLNAVEPVHMIQIPKTPDIRPMFNFNMAHLNSAGSLQAKSPITPLTPVTPVINIDFTKNIGKPEIKVLDSTVSMVVKNDTSAVRNLPKPLLRQSSKSKMAEAKRPEPKPDAIAPQINIDNLNSGNLQIDEDYDT